jgi:hypothetical protein
MKDHFGFGMQEADTRQSELSFVRLHLYSKIYIVLEGKKKPSKASTNPPDG